MFWGTLATVWIGFFPNNYYYTGDSSNRCAIRDCLCEVDAKEQQTLYPKSKSSKRISVYFNENSHFVSEIQSDTIREFLRLQTSRHVTIIGYTDGCGSASHNKQLASKRASEVKKILGVSTSNIVVHGELKSSHVPEARKVDIVFHKENLSAAIEKIPADFYLLDASGSMSIFKWQQIIGGSLKANSRVFISKTHGCRYHQALSTIKPSGGTEIWYSYWKIIEEMKAGETLLIISDFQSNYPLSRNEWFAIEEKVKSKGIRIYVINPSKY
jgi:hypothetical protein